MPSWLSFGLIVALSTGVLSQQSKDPLKDFCRKFGHQTAIVDDKLYIDGGIVNWGPLNQNSLNYSNKYFVYSDLKEISNGMPTQHANLSKPAEVPLVEGGTLWADPVNKWIHLYGGEYHDANPDALSLWSYDILNNVWKSSGVTNFQIQRVSYGAGATAEEDGKGYYYGGWLSNSSVPAFGARMPTSNLIIYDMVKDTWANNTGPDSIPRAEGVMVYIPASDAGMLVYFGGLYFPGGPGNYTGIGMNMSEIKVFDISDNKWYTQTATGDIPNSRRRFCAGATWAKDRSSYNIYLYGGASMPPNTIGFDDVYILSLPSFTWLKWYPDAPGPGAPHHSLTCNVVRGSQMIVMGGTFPNDTTLCDVPTVQGQHNLNLGKENSLSAKWYQYLDNVTDYKVPEEIVAKVGGQASGGATVLAPKTWDNNLLPTYFQRAYTPTSRTPTRSIPATRTPTATHTSAGGKKTPTKVIAGAAAGGGAAVLICIALGVFFCCIKKDHRSAPTQPAELENTEGDHTGGPDAEGAAKPYRGQAPPTPVAELPQDNGYTFPPPASPSMYKDPDYAHSPPSSVPGSPPIPQPYYRDGRESLNIPNQVQQPFGYSPSHSPQPVQGGEWPDDYRNTYYPPPLSEMSAIRSPPPPGQNMNRNGDEDGIYPAPVPSGLHSARASPHHSRQYPHDNGGYRPGFSHGRSLSGQTVTSGMPLTPVTPRSFGEPSPVGSEFGQGVRRVSQAPTQSYYEGQERRM
ncbi:uncharacterized protein BDR25DRAFT_264696 [Lindgomyces ingoldianus]|uniref:Uncharacterized protein n=1 Tax=Lindgomyces ingoldianus TaxID=673940 RepID=A0ACB6QP96_9PLEO|nr:uncharacterized protein BDR25DRAFT_264696 [Lindgomyces ingoldianus]KAF2468798.1 hypothetical protein BDR25DRAFT_264696 [Lindgomyces ingoldianus]